MFLSRIDDMYAGVAHASSKDSRSAIYEIPILEI